MPRPKRSSDEVYNARRRAKRALARAEKAGNTELASSLREIVKASYAKSQPGKTVLQGSSTSTQPIQETKPAQAITRQPRAKRPSDELYNARRRLKRQAERIEREAKGYGATERKLAEGYAQYLRQQATPTGKLSPDERSKALERLGKVREETRGITYDPFRVRRRNAILQQQLNAAGTEGAESSISERKKSVFWAATKGLWPKGANVLRNERYDLILSHFYTDQTTDAIEFRKWLEKKGLDPQENFGDLQLVYEYITEELNDPSIYELPEVPYATAMDLIRTAM